MNLTPFLAALIMLTSAVPGGDPPADSLWTELSSAERAKPVTGTVKLVAFADLAEKLSPSVVHISVTRKTAANDAFGLYSDPFLRDFFGMPPPESYSEGLGSGFVINESGYIVTNNHVVEQATEVRVKLRSGKEYVAIVLGADPKTDLALLRIECSEPLTPAPLGDSEELRIGEWVIAIGNPFGLDQTVTAGIVSAKGRKEVMPGPDFRYANFIQTDASINPGNSGGPLFNMRGEVVGINAAIVAAGQGVGFAIPVNMAKQLIPQLAIGKVERSYIGVLIQPLTPEMAESLGIDDIRGALVAQVTPGSPAEEAGVREGDVIVRFDGQVVADSSSLPWMAATAGVGKEVELEVIRQGKAQTVNLVLGRLPDDGMDVPSPSLHSDKDDNLSATGVTVGPLADTGGKSATGVQVLAVDGAAATAAGVRAGDVIHMVGHIKVKNPKHFVELCGNVPTGKPISFHLKRGGVSLWVAFLKE